MVTVRENAVRLSIVMPCFNRHEQLKLMIDSILANSFTDWELIVVDDGSDADTLNLLNQYSIDNRRIYIIQRGERQPKGAQTCRNIGLEASKGEYVIFFDSDDYIEPFCLKQRVEQMDSHPLLDFMVFPSTVLDDGEQHNEKVNSLFGYKIHKDDIAGFARRELPFIVWNNIYRKDSLLKYNIRWDEKLLSLQDSDFNMMAILSGLKYEYAEMPPDIRYRRPSNKGSVSDNIKTLKHLDSNLYSVDKFYKEVQERYGHKFDSDLYKGMLFIFVSAYFYNDDRTIATLLHKLIYNHDKKHAREFLCSWYISRLLATILPLHLARKVAFAPYLLHLRRFTKKTKLQIARLSEIYQHKENK